MREDQHEFGRFYRPLPLGRPARLPAAISSRDVGGGGAKFMGFTSSGGVPTVALYPENRSWGFHDDGTTTYLVFNRNGVIIYVPISSTPTFPETTPAQITADQNNYNPGVGSYHRLSTDAARTVTSIVAGTAGQPKFIANVGGFNLVLANQNASSTAANRIITATGANVTLAPDDTAIMLYDGASSRWRLFA